MEINAYFYLKGIKNKSLYTDIRAILNNHPHVFITINEMINERGGIPGTVLTQSNFIIGNDNMKIPTKREYLLQKQNSIDTIIDTNILEYGRLSNFYIKHEINPYKKFLMITNSTLNLIIQSRNDDYLWLYQSKADKVLKTFQELRNQDKISKNTVKIFEEGCVEDYNVLDKIVSKFDDSFKNDSLLREKFIIETIKEQNEYDTECKLDILCNSLIYGNLNNNLNKEELLSVLKSTKIDGNLLHI